MSIGSRSWVLEIIIIIFFTSIFLRLSSLHLNPKEFVSYKKTEKIRTYEEKSVGDRGQIVDRKGNLLATDIAGYTLYIDPKFISENGDPELVAKTLSEIFSALEENKILDQISNTNRRYTELIRKVSVNYPGIENIKKRNSVSISAYSPSQEKYITLKGVGLVEQKIRSYPQGLRMAHILGYVNAERVGSGGIEQRYNKYLLGKDGYRKSKQDASEREIYHAREIDRLPENGAKITLTLDQYIQRWAEEAIYDVKSKYKTDGVWVIVQNVKTGEILAMASEPTFDPNKYNKANNEWRRNRSISFNYDPGSTFKAATIAVALDKNIIKTNDIFSCENGYWNYAGAPVIDTKKYGNLNVSDILKFSSNIGAAKIAISVGNQNLYNGLKKFQFGEKLNIDLPGEEKGKINNPSEWTKVDTTRIAMGYGITATGIQIISMMSAIANNGILMKPIIVKNITSNNGEILFDNISEEISRPIKSETSKKMISMLTQAVEGDGGTGRSARIDGYSIAGKTGTAQKAIPLSKGGGYYKDKYISSFVGFFPANNPQISILVVADDPKGKYYGGSVCGPAFKKIAEETIKYLNIPPSDQKIGYEAEN